MGGGDLNSKKAWHPSTLKNQERVWKAEQAAAEEKKRIMELQRERAEERDKEEFNELAKRTTSASGCSSNDNRLHWMYDKPDKKVQQEDYLLGKSINSKHEHPDKADVIPAVARRVIGSSMLPASSDTQVDLTRKLREDPLLLIKERERAARAALLNNPLQRKRLTELLRKEQDQCKEIKEKKKSKNKQDYLDNILAAKLNALGAKKGVDLKTLLAFDDSSSDSSSDESTHDKKKRNKKKNKKAKKEDKIRTCDDSDKEVRHSQKLRKLKNHEMSIDGSMQRKRKKSYSESDNDYKMHAEKHRQNTTGEKKKHHDKYHCDSTREVYKKISEKKATPHEHSKRRYINKEETKGKIREGISDPEKAAKLAEMAAAGAEREFQRGRRVAQQLKEDAFEKSSNLSQHSRRKEACSLPDSLESRIHSNRHYIQRDQRHMDEHFAKR